MHQYLGVPLIMDLLAAGLKHDHPKTTVVVAFFAELFTFFAVSYIDIGYYSGT
jgi:hypothetical protein